MAKKMEDKKSTAKPKPMKPKAKANPNPEAKEAPKPSRPNLGKCCTCRFYDKPCRKTGNYTARKAEHPECYKEAN